MFSATRFAAQMHDSLQELVQSVTHPNQMWHIRSWWELRCDLLLFRLLLSLKRYTFQIPRIDIHEDQIQLMQTQFALFCSILGNALERRSARVKSKVEFCSFLPYFLPRCAPIAMGCTQHTGNHSADYAIIVRGERLLIWVRTVDAHHWGINKRKHTFKEKFISFA